MRELSPTQYERAAKAEDELIAGRRAKRALGKMLNSYAACVLDGWNPPWHMKQAVEAGLKVMKPKKSTLSPQEGKP